MTSSILIIRVLQIADECYNNPPSFVPLHETAMLKEQKKKKNADKHLGNRTLVGNVCM